jgi:hypothetical protein
MPALGGRLRALALTKTDWDVDAALALLRSFQVAQLEKLNVITKVGGEEDLSMPCWDRFEKVQGAREGKLSQLVKCGRSADTNALHQTFQKRKRIMEEIDDVAEAAPGAKAAGDGEGGGGSGSSGSSSGSESDSGSDGGRRSSKKVGGF